MDKKVFVSGCFDMLHSGHVAFIKSAARFGKVYVCIGSDRTVFELKKRYPLIPEQERKYMLEALSDVHRVFIGSASGYLDFLPEFHQIQPHLFVVNEDGFSPEKEELCKAHGVELKVLQRIPEADLQARSTTALRSHSNIPFRIDLAGGWLDQPFVSMHAPGPVITISIEPNEQFNERSGMSSSTRKVAIELWQNDLPAGNEERNAKILFAYENPPGKTEIAGSQDAIGIVFPGLNKSNYHGKYWPLSIDSQHNEEILSFIEEHLYLVNLGPRSGSYDVLANTHISKQGALRLSEATEDCWKAIHDKDPEAFGSAMTRSFSAQIEMFPNMVDPDILATIKRYQPQALGWKISGAGGGGYLILLAKQAIEGALKIRIRRKKSNG